ncbi:MAG: helix-turn-helix domain-containing protein [Bacillota bacterium]
MGSRYISSGYQLDNATNRLLDVFPVHCHFRDGVIGQSQMHAHRGYEIYFCLEGHGKLLVADHVYSLLPGALAIIKPHVFHRPSVIGTKPLHRVVLSLDEHYVQTSFDNSPGISTCLHTLLAEPQPYWRLATAKMDSIRDLLLRLTRELADQQDFYIAAMHHLLAELFVILAREQYCPPDTDTSENAAFHLAERILRYLTAHYAESIEVSCLHEQFNVSRSHMYDQFKQATGHSLNRFLTIYRINQAKRLLMDTPLSVTEIASAVGFGDLSHFFHTFKSETGLTPSAFRKQTGN